MVSAAAIPNLHSVRDPYPLPAFISPFSRGFIAATESPSRQTRDTTQGVLMRIDVATERLLPGQMADRVTFAPKDYGRTFCISVFGWTLVVDFIAARRDRC